MAFKNEFAAERPHLRQEPAEHDRVAEALLEVDEQFFLGDRFASPKGAGWVMFASAGLKPVLEIDPALLELPLQQSHLGAVAPGGGVFRVALDHAEEKRLSPR